MVRVKALTERTVAERFAEIKEEDGIWGDISEQSRLVAKRIIESSLEEELTERLAASRYRRTEVRRGWRNGGYSRQVVTRWGVVDVWMPRARKALPASNVLDRFQRREARVDQLIRDAFLRGISTREVGDVLEPVVGWKPSAQTVSRVARSLDSAVRHFHWRRLTDDIEYLLLDGVTMKIKAPGGVKKKLVLVAYGIGSSGQRQLLDFKLAESESSAQWEAFLEDLFRRGLEGQHLRLIATDGGAGLAAALAIVYPRALHQRCWAHKLRNVAAKLPRKHQEDCLRGAKGIYLAATASEADKRFRQWKEEWGAIAPKAVACLEHDLESLLAFFACPGKDALAIRTTNAIERSFREVRRRTRTMSCFQNRASCERIIFAVIHHLNLRWSHAFPSQSTQDS